MPRHPRRAGPVWAWALALLLLIALIVILMIRRDRDAAPVVEPAAAPAAAAVDDGWGAAARLLELTELEAIASPVPLDDLVPLGPAHTGVLVRFDGVTASRVDALGFWLRTAGDGLVFLRLLEPGFPAAEPGSAVAGRGVIRFDSDGRLAARLARSDLEPTLQGHAFGEYYIETTSSRIDAS